MGGDLISAFKGAHVRLTRMKTVMLLVKAFARNTIDIIYRPFSVPDILVMFRINVLTNQLIQCLLFCSIVFWSFTSTAQVVVEVHTTTGIKAFPGYRNEAGAWVFNAGSDKKVTMATLNWTPYIGDNICGQGWVQQLVVSVFIKNGYEVHSHFVPWKRAVAMAESGKVDVLYPEYAIAPNAPSDIIPGKRRSDLLILSEPFTGGVVSLIKHKNSSTTYNGDLLALRDVTIGVVAGYENSPEFDALMDDGYLTVSQAADDWTNLRKLHGQRIELIVADPQVMRHTVRQNLGTNAANRFLADLKVLQPNLAVHPLYLAFSSQRQDIQHKVIDFNTELVLMRESGDLEKIRDKWQVRSGLNKLCQ